MDALTPNAAERVARARSDLAIGLPVVLTGPQGNVLCAAAEGIAAPRLQALTARGDARLVVTHWRAETLKIRVYDGDLARLPLHPDVTPRDIAAIADPSDDLGTPLKGPFVPLRGGDVALDRAALTLVKTVRRLPAAILAPTDTPPPGLTILGIADLAQGTAPFRRIVSAGLPIAAATATRLHVYRPDDGQDEHYAVEIGTRGNPPLVRLHSSCFTGDVLGSLKCDCGPQLHAAIDAMAVEGGVLLYLNQEGRGIGLANKMRAYALQDQGFDTVEANHRLGFDDDERDFGIGATILHRMGIGAVRLLTNNPRKVAMLQAAGIDVVERVPLWVGRGPLNDAYLRAKTHKSGHLE